MTKKGEKTKERLIMAAQTALGQFGEHKTTFQKIADISGVSQALVVHHFKSRENIFLEVIKSIMDDALVETEETLHRAQSAMDRIESYIDISLELARRSPDVGRVFLLFYYQSAYDPKIAVYNDKIKKEAIARIESILIEGNRSGEFQVKDTKITSKIIHTSLNGLILTLISEPKQSFPDSKLILELKKLCRAHLLDTSSASKTSAG